MASDVDICNTALSHLGDDAMITSIAPADGSVQARYCAIWYPMARDELLEMCAWNMNTRRITLALAPDTPPDGWAFAYQIPNKMLKPLAVIAPGALPDFISWWEGLTVNDMQVTATLVDSLNSQDYIVEESYIDGSLVIYTNVENAILAYQERIDNTARFLPLFTAALARLLAAKIAGPLIKGSTGAEVAEKQLGIFAKMDLPLAMTADANSRQSSPYRTGTPAPIAARY